MTLHQNNAHKITEELSGRRTGPVGTIIIWSNSRSRLSTSKHDPNQMFVCRCRCGALNIKNPQLQVTDCWTFHIITQVTRIHVISSVYIFWWTITIVTSKQWSLDFRWSIYRYNYTPIHLLHLRFVKKKTKCIYSLFLLPNLKERSIG